MNALIKRIAREVMLLVNKDAMLQYLIEAYREALVTFDPEYADVRRFHQKIGLLVTDAPTHLTGRKLKERIEFLQEELDEFGDCAALQDLKGMFDALLDIVYVAKGTAVMMGLPWAEGWREVQRSNMEKVPGVTHRGHQVDAKKPEGWLPPRLDLVLRIAGYDPRDWYHPGGGFREEAALDDEVHMKDGLAFDEGADDALH